MASSYDKSRLAFAELQIVSNNLKPNFVMMPLLASLISVMFSQWVPHGVVRLVRPRVRRCNSSPLRGAKIFAE